MPNPSLSPRAVADDDQVADHDPSEVLDPDGRAAATADRRPAASVAADGDRLRRLGPRSRAASTRLPANSAPPSNRMRSPGPYAPRLTRSMLRHGAAAVPEPASSPAGLT